MPTRPSTCSGPVRRPPVLSSLAVSRRITSVARSLKSLERRLSPWVLGKGGSGLSGIAASFRSERDRSRLRQIEGVDPGNDIEVTRLYIRPAGAHVELRA